jgi:RNA polymerase subunit RPABC4/transcription elongation factor Spt4
MYWDDGSCLLILAIAIIIGLIPAAIANRKGRSFLNWWLFGAALFIVAFPASLLLAPNREELEEREIRMGNAKRCPYCAELVKSDAQVCKHCGRDLARRCPHCAELVHPDAKVCKHCGAELTSSELSSEPDAG